MMFLDCVDNSFPGQTEGTHTEKVELDVNCQITFFFISVTTIYLQFEVVLIISNGVWNEGFNG